MNRSTRTWLCGMALAALLTPAAVRAAASEEDASTKVDLSRVRERAESMPSDLRRDTDRRIAITIERVNKEASDRGQTTMAARLAAEFKQTPDGLLDDKADFGLSWGEMVISETLLANSATKVTLADLAALRRDGLGWGAIAYGLEFHMEDFEDVVKAEGRVAMGLGKSENKAAAAAK